MEQALVTLVTGIVIALVSAFVAVRLALHRFRAEKLWERKVAAYERIIESLHDLKTFSDNHIRAEKAGQELPQETDEELRSRSRAGHEVISRAADMGSFMISPAALAILKRFKSDSEKASSTRSWIDYLISDNKACSTCLQDLVSEAKRDLGMK